MLSVRVNRKMLSNKGYFGFICYCFELTNKRPGLNGKNEATRPFRLTVYQTYVVVTTSWLMTMAE